MKDLNGDVVGDKAKIFKAKETDASWRDVPDMDIPGERLPRPKKSKREPYLVIPFQAIRKAAELNLSTTALCILAYAGYCDRMEIPAQREGKLTETVRGRLGIGKRQQQEAVRVLRERCSAYVVVESRAYRSTRVQLTEAGRDLFKT